MTILATGLAKSSRDFLRLTPEPPIPEAIDEALRTLYEVGAILLPNLDSPKMSQKEQLTLLGQHLSRLPVNIRVGKMLVYGALFKCIEPIATIAACLSASQSIFSTVLDETKSASAVRAAFLDQQSDFLTLRRVFEAFAESNASGKASKFCRDNYLNFAALREIRDARVQYLDLLCGFGFLQRSDIGLEGSGRLDEKRLAKASANLHGKDDSMIHAIILSALYPNVGRLTGNNTKQAVLQHKSEVLYIHSSSVNQKVPPYVPSRWLAFHEKLGTANRVSVSVTCFIEPLAIMLFGSSLEVNHFERKVVIDGWIELNSAAQLSVMMKMLRGRLDLLLNEMFDMSLDRTSLDVHEKIIDGIAKLIIRK